MYDRTARKYGKTNPGFNFPEEFDSPPKVLPRKKPRVASPSPSASSTTTTSDSSATEKPSYHTVDEGNPLSCSFDSLYFSTTREQTRSSSSDIDNFSGHTAHAGPSPSLSSLAAAANEVGSLLFSMRNQRPSSSATPPNTSGIPDISSRMVHGDALSSFFHDGSSKEAGSMPLSVGTQGNYPPFDSPDTAAATPAHHPNSCASFLSSLNDSTAPSKSRTEVISSRMEALCSLLSLANDSLGPSRKWQRTATTTSPFPPSTSCAVDSLSLPYSFSDITRSLSSMSGDITGVGSLPPFCAPKGDRYRGLSGGE